MTREDPRDVPPPSSELQLGDVPVAIGRTAYRIVQEAVTNVRKHAHGVAVSLLLHGSAGNMLTVEVRNPMPLNVGGIPGGGTGLVGLTQRAELAGGRLEYGRTRDGHEFLLVANLPWPA